MRAVRSRTCSRQAAAAERSAHFEAVVSRADALLEGARADLLRTREASESSLAALQRDLAEVARGAQAPCATGVHSPGISHVEKLSTTLFYAPGQ